MESQKISPNRLKVLGDIVFYLFLIVGVGVISLVLDQPKIHLQVFRWLATGIGILLFGTPLVLSLLQLFSPEPLLILNDEGIVDNAVVTGAGLVRWEDIERVYIGRLVLYNYIRYYICVVPRDAPRLLARQSGFRHFTMKLNQIMLEAPVAIRIAFLSQPPEAVLQTIQDRVSRANAHR